MLADGPGFGVEFSGALPLAVFEGWVVIGSWSSFRFQWTGSMRIRPLVMERREHPTPTLLKT